MYSKLVQVINVVPNHHQGSLEQTGNDDLDYRSANAVLLTIWNETQRGHIKNTQTPRITTGMMSLLLGLCTRQLENHWVSQPPGPAV